MAPPVVVESFAPLERFDLGNTRFYERQYPDKEELVMVKVVRSAEMGAYVSLLEYNGVEGMILMSELSKRRIRSVKKVVRVGRHEVVLVLRVDKEKGYIDLSKKRVSVEDIEKCEERFSKSKRVHQIICHISQKYRIKVEDLNKQITWPLHKKYGHALDAFKDPNFTTTIIDELNLSPDIKEALISDVQLRLAAHSMRMRARIDVWCYGSEGVDAVRSALIKGKEAASVDQTDPTDVKVKLIAPPQYTLITPCVNKADGEQRLSQAIKVIEETIRSFKGGDAKQQGEFLMIGGEDEKPLGDAMGSDDSSDSDTSEDEEEEEDEGMGRVEDNDMPEDEIEEDDEEELPKTK